MLSTSFSDFLGYTSIACWLGAQFPQLLENVRNQSVEGLALPFLMNWLLGDATNLVGCLLTHQLPFQTYLATYFCFVDFTLLSQYIYYSLHAKKPARPPYLHGRDRSTTVTSVRRLSVDRGATAPHYRALSNVAANVAAVAALAAQQEEHARWGRRSYSIEPHPTEYDDDEDISEEALARMAESLHSDLGRSARRKQVGWSQTVSREASTRRSRQPSQVPTVLQMTGPTEGTEVSARGRSTVRAVDMAVDGEDWLAANTQRRGSRASRKGATMVFMGVWALFGIGTLAAGRTSIATGVMERTGRVLARADVPTPVFSGQVQDPRLKDSMLSAQLAGEPSVFHFSHSSEDMMAELSSEPEPGPTTEYLIGRISAWICTTLYLTSRLPQIWKNYVRKSVEGLSIYLFIFAFLGNFFYVASILTSSNMQLPEPQLSAFIRESIPYLLGSGGTLMFDITIVTQSILYRPKGGSHGRRASRTYNEEEAGLLSAEATGPEESPTASRRRVGSVTRDGTGGF